MADLLRLVPAVRSATPEAAAFRRFSRVIPLANVCGGVTVFVFFYYVLPLPPVARLGDFRRVNLICFGAYMVASFVAATLWSNARGEPIVNWLDSGRDATECELTLVLRHPLHQATVSAATWLGALVVFGLLDATYSPPLGGLAAVATILGGATTSALTYLLAERLLRPVAARAFAACAPPRAVVPGVAARVLLAWGFTTAVPLIAAAALAAAVVGGTRVSPTRLATTALVLCLAALALGAFAMGVVARSLSDPLRLLRSALRRVQRGELDVRVPVDDASEVGVLEAGFNHMVAGLRERVLLRDLFGRHVGEDVARQAIEQGVELGGEVREAAVLFVDLIGSTAIASTRPPDEVMSLLNRYFAIIVDVVTAHHGYVNKFEGDGALCVFGAPVARDDPSACALATACALDARLRSELPAVRAAIGVSAGALVAGNVGAAERFEYTVIGDPVNEAARLVELAKATPRRVLACAAVVERAPASERDRWRYDGVVALRGRRRETRLAVPSRNRSTSAPQTSVARHAKPA